MEHSKHIMENTGAHTSINTQRVESFFLSGLEVKASIFHVGQYCDYWESSLHGQAKAGFHIVLYGPCWLHFPDRESRCLQPGEAVFFLRDVPHVLSPSAQRPDFSQPLQRQLMQAVNQPAANPTGLLCGFLRFTSGLADLLLFTLPDTLCFSEESPVLESQQVVSLIQREIQQHAHRMNTVVIERLIELLLFYTLRAESTQLHGEPSVQYGVLTLAQDPVYGQLLAAIVQEPAKDWTVDDMAAYCHASRASFHRRFTLLGGMSPAQLLLLVRVQLSKSLLLNGRSIEQVAEHVGYGSAASFSSAFKRVEGISPSAWREGQ